MSRFSPLTLVAGQLLHGQRQKRTEGGLESTLFASEERALEIKDTDGFAARRDMVVIVGRIGASIPGKYVGPT